MNYHNHIYLLINNITGFGQTSDSLTVILAHSFSLPHNKIIIWIQSLSVPIIIMYVQLYTDDTSNRQSLIFEVKREIGNMVRNLREDR